VRPFSAAFVFLTLDEPRLVIRSRIWRYGVFHVPALAPHIGAWDDPSRDFLKVGILQLFPLHHLLAGFLEVVLALVKSVV
jgi:hypothetical protein